MSAKAPQTPARATDSRPSLAFLPVPLLFLAVPLRALDSLFVWTDHGEIVMGLMIRPLETWPRILSEPMVVGFDEAGVEAPRCSRPLQVIAMYCGVNLELGYPEDSLDYFDRLTAGNPLLESSPAVAHCGAMSLLETGSWQRAVPVLEALYRQGGGGYATDEVAVEIASAFARAGRGEDARAWLVRLGDLPADPKIAHKVARARALVEANAGD